MILAFAMDSATPATKVSPIAVGHWNAGFGDMTFSLERIAERYVEQACPAELVHLVSRRCEC
jgi:hypothetical protein